MGGGGQSFGYSLSTNYSVEVYILGFLHWLIESGNREGRIGSFSSFQNEVLEYYGADLLLKAMSKGMVGTKAEVAFSTGRFGVEDHTPPTVYRLVPVFPGTRSLHPLFGAW